jgi:hypothetical protein
VSPQLCQLLREYRELLLCALLYEHIDIARSPPGPAMYAHAQLPPALAQLELRIARFVSRVSDVIGARTSKLHAFIHLVLQLMSVGSISLLSCYGFETHLRSVAEHVHSLRPDQLPQQLARTATVSSLIESGLAELEQRDAVAAARVRSFRCNIAVSAPTSRALADAAAHGSQRGRVKPRPLAVVLADAAGAASFPPRVCLLLGKERGAATAFACMRADVAAGSDDPLRACLLQPPPHLPPALATLYDASRALSAYVRVRFSPRHNHFSVTLSTTAYALKHRRRNDIVRVCLDSDTLALLASLRFRSGAYYAALSALQRNVELADRWFCAQVLAVLGPPRSAPFADLSDDARCAPLLLVRPLRVDRAPLCPEYSALCSSLVPFASVERPVDAQALVDARDVVMVPLACVLERLVALPGRDDAHVWVCSEVAVCGGDALTSDAEDDNDGDEPAPL